MVRERENGENFFLRRKKEEKWERVRQSERERERRDEVKRVTHHFGLIFCGGLSKKYELLNPKKFGLQDILFSANNRYR